MIRSAVTISLVPEARGGPFVFWNGLDSAIQAAAGLGFDGVELFVPSADAVDPKALQKRLRDHGLKLAAVGTGAGWVLHGWQLSDKDKDQRSKACRFVHGIIDFAGACGAPAIIGSMQGKQAADVSLRTARSYLRGSLEQLATHAEQYQVPLLLEPLNRYETNLLNTLADALSLVEGISNARLLADLFHMNIEEADVAASIEQAGTAIGHVHFVDSNRQAVGRGHLDVQPVVAALRRTGYDGYFSAEALPQPDSLAAAEATIAAFRRYCR